MNAHNLKDNNYGPSVSLIIFFCKLVSCPKVCHLEYIFRGLKKALLAALKKQQKMPVCISNELCVVLTLITEYSVNKTYIPFSHAKRQD